MRSLRSAILGGLGLVGIANASPSIITSVIDRTFQREVIEYGDAVVLFYNSAPTSEETRTQTWFLEEGFYKTAEISKRLEKDGKPIVFAKYDVNHLAVSGLSPEEVNNHVFSTYELTGFPSVVLYRDGELIDQYPCTPKNQEAIDPMVFNMSKGWLPSRFVGPLDGEIFGYEGTCQLHAIDEE